MHPFNRITDYSSTGNVFQMTVRTLVKGINFVCATPQVSGPRLNADLNKVKYQRPFLPASGRDDRGPRQVVCQDVRGAEDDLSTEEQHVSLRLHTEPLGFPRTVIQYL